MATAKTLHVLMRYSELEPTTALIAHGREDKARHLNPKSETPDPQTHSSPPSPNNNGCLSPCCLATSGRSWEDQCLQVRSISFRERTAGRVGDSPPKQKDRRVHVQAVFLCFYALRAYILNPYIHTLKSQPGHPKP